MRLGLFGMLLIGLADLAPAQSAQPIAVGEYAVPSPGGAALGIARGLGSLWFTDPNGNAIGRCRTTAEIVEYPLPTHGAAPGGIVEGPDQAMWFTEQNGNKIGRITGTGEITEYPLPVSNELPQQITAGLDGILWFTAPGTVVTGGGRIGRITTAGAITQYSVAGGKGIPWGSPSGRTERSGSPTWQGTRLDG
jgi:virginiamycin B lyase